MNLELLTTIGSANTPKIPIISVRLSAISASVGLAKAGAVAMKAIARASANVSLVMIAILDVRTVVRASCICGGLAADRLHARTNATCSDALQ
jgi:hypothetical protein